MMDVEPYDGVNDGLSSTTDPRMDFRQTIQEQTYFDTVRYNALLSSSHVQNDPLFKGAFSDTQPYKLSRVNYLKPVTKVLLTRRFSTTTPSPISYLEKDGQLLLEDLFEISMEHLPAHVKHCISTVGDDFVVCDPVDISPESVSPPKKQTRQVGKNKIVDINYEIDSVAFRKDEKNKMASFFPTNPPPQIDLLSANMDESIRLLDQAYNPEKSANFMFEANVDVEETKVTSLDLLYTNISKEELIPESAYVLFTPQSLHFKVFEKHGSQPFEDIYCSVSIYDIGESLEFIRLAETFTFCFSDSNFASQKALFHVGALNDSLVAIFKFARRYKGEYTDAFNDLYLSGDKAREKDIPLVKAKAKYYDNLDDTFSYFAWTAIRFNTTLTTTQIFDISDIYLLPSSPGNVRNQSLLSSFLYAPERNTKVIPGSFSVGFSCINSDGCFVYSAKRPTVTLDSEEHRVILCKMLDNLALPIKDVENVCIIRPLSVSLSKSCKNCQIVVSLCSRDYNMELPGLKAFVPSVSQIDRHDHSFEGVSFITYNNSGPEFSEEIKFKFPAKLEDDHHLLFKFYNIKKNGTKELHSYAFLRLLGGGRLVNGAYDLSLYKVKNQSATYNYMSDFDARRDGSSFKLVLYSRSVSYPVGSHDNISQFFSFMEEYPDYSSLKKKRLQQCLTGLSKPIPTHLSSFAPMILNQLFSIIEGNTNFEVRFSTFQAVMEYVNISLRDQPYILKAYVKYYFYHSNICDALLIPIQAFLEQDGSHEQKIVLKYSWFIFSILLKAILLHVDLKKNVERQMDFEFSPLFLDMLSELIVKTFGMIILKNEDKDLTELSAVIGNFLMRLLPVMETSYVLQIASEFYTVLAQLSAKRHDEQTVKVQLAFFEQLFTYKHYIMLFLPQTVQDSMKITNDSVLGRENLSLINYNHTMYTAFVDIIIKSLDNPSRAVRMKAVHMFRNLVTRTNCDTRYQAPEFKCRINQIHFEFVQKFMDILADWKNHCDVAKKRISGEIVDVRKQMEVINGTLYLLRLSKTDIEKLNQSSITQSLSHVTKEIKSYEENLAELQRKITQLENEMKKEQSLVTEEYRLLLSCVVYVLMHMDADLLATWYFYDEGDLTKRQQFTDLFQTLLFSFEYYGAEELSSLYLSLYKKNTQISRRKKVMQSSPTALSPEKPPSIDLSRDKRSSYSKFIKIPKRMSSSQSLKKLEESEEPKRRSGFIKSMLQLKGDTEEQSKKDSSLLKLFKPDTTKPVESAETRESQRIDAEMLKEQYVLSKVFMEKHVSNDVSFYCLWFLVRLVSFSKKKERKQIGVTIIRTFVFFLHLNQSEHVLIYLLAYLRAFCAEYRTTLYNPKSELGAMLAEALMCLCNSTLESVRKQAAATTYILIRTGYELTGAINSPRNLTIIALSRTLQNTFKEENLMMSLRFIAEISNTDHLSEEMQQDIRKLCVQLEKIVKDTLAVNRETSGLDIQKSEQLLLNISTLYESIPELQILWLNKLAQFHKQHEQHAECAQCYLQILSIVIRVMKTKKLTSFQALPLHYFFDLCPQYQQDDSEEHHCDLQAIQAAEFTESKLHSFIRKAILALQDAEQYEFAIPLLKITLAIFERENDLFNLSDTYNQISKMLEKVHSSNTYNTRQFSTYYRVSFHGDPWEDLNGKSFIYKMPKLFKLFMMTTKVKEMFGDIELLNTPQVDTTSLDLTKRYIQLTNVKPYLGESESQRKTLFQQSNGIQQFYFESAFSPNSKKLSDKVTEIYKRKVVLTSEKSFPYLLTRVNVMKEEERILTPIETAIENIESQIQKLEDVLDVKIPDIAQLQLVLQGSVRAGVNGGPKDIVESFLSQSERVKYNGVHVERLNERCNHFLYLCERALVVDARLAKANQKNMHVELEKGFLETKHLLDLHLHKTKAPQRDQKKPSIAIQTNKQQKVSVGVDGDEAKYADEFNDLQSNGVPYNRYYRLQNIIKQKSQNSSS